MILSQHLKRTAGLAFALGAILPAAASATQAESGGGSSTIPQSPAVRITTPRTGFDWGDAGIGATGGIAIAMLAVGGGLVVSHHRPRRTRQTNGLPN
jgi:hypothetical protein